MYDLGYVIVIVICVALPVQRGLTLSSGSESSSSAWAATTRAFIAEPDHSGYNSNNNTSVLSSSLFRTSHIGQSWVLHILVTANSKPPMPNRCQKHRPSLTFPSAKRKYLSSEQSSFISSLTWSIICPCSGGPGACTSATRRCWWRRSASVWVKEREVSMLKEETWRYDHY